MCQRIILDSIDTLKEHLNTEVSAFVLEFSNPVLT